MQKTRVKQIKLVDVFYSIGNNSFHNAKRHVRLINLKIIILSMDWKQHWLKIIPI